MRRAIAVQFLEDDNGAKVSATVTLAFDDRHRRRVRMTDDSGAPFLLDLAEATLLADGDGLALEGGGCIRVRAADEDVADIHCASDVHAARMAWHIGNRHVPVQVLGDDTLRIRYDHVLVRMAEGLGADVTRRTAPFVPQQGAYAPHPEPGDGPGDNHGQ